MDMATFKKLQKEALLVWPPEGRGHWRVGRGEGGTSGKGLSWMGGLSGQGPLRGWGLGRGGAIEPRPAPKSEVLRQGLWAGEAWGALDTAESSSLWTRGGETLTVAWGLWQPLTIAEVQRLLGPNLEGLKAEQGSSPVRDWIFQQRQSDLDSLGLGLHGGIPNGYLVLDLNFRGGQGGRRGGLGR